jgi:hypothetical protein
MHRNHKQINIKFNKIENMKIINFDMFDDVPQASNS